VGKQQQQATTSSSLRLASQSDDDFWAKQKQLMEEMSDSADKSLRIEQEEEFSLRRNYLIGDTAYVSLLIFCILWGVANTVFTPISYAFGAICGLAYSYGLSKFVETIGRSFDDEAVEGSGVGQARFAFLFLLIIFIGKYRYLGLQEIPSILGFFTYQLSTLGQGLRETND